jgi:hypothetical protein
MISKQEMLKPFIKTVLSKMDSPVAHDGLDVKIKNDHVYIDPFNRGPNSYEIVFKGRPFGSDVYPAKTIRHLFNDVIVKYYETKGSVKDKCAEMQNDIAQLKSFTIKDGKYLTKIVEVESDDEAKCKYNFETHDQSMATDEVKQIAADLLSLLSIANSAINKKIMRVNSKMRIGVLDTNRHTGELIICTGERQDENGEWKGVYETYTKENVPKSLLITTLWFTLKLHQSSKLFLDHINFEVEYKTYKAKIMKGEVHLETEGQSNLVKEIYQDLRRME